MQTYATIILIILSSIAVILCILNIILMNDIEKENKEIKKEIDNLKQKWKNY